MHEHQTGEFTNNALADQVKGFQVPAATEPPPQASSAVAPPPHQSVAPPAVKAAEGGPAAAMLPKNGIMHPTRRFLMPQVIPVVAAATEEEGLVAALLDEASSVVSEIAGNLRSVWEECSHANEGTYGYGASMAKAERLMESLLSLLELAAVDSETKKLLSQKSRALFARMTAMQYAIAVGGNIGTTPIAEQHRALWFLRQTGVISLATREPEAILGVPGGTKMWLGFPYALRAGPRTAEGHVVERSGILSALPLLLNAVVASDRACELALDQEKHAVTFQSPDAFFAAPAEGKFLLSVHPSFRKDRGEHFGGGHLLVSARGDSAPDMWLVVDGVIDASVLHDFEHAVRLQDSTLRTRFVTLSLRLERMLAGARLGKIRFPLSAFQGDNLRREGVVFSDAASFSEDPAVLQNVAQMLKWAIRGIQQPQPGKAPSPPASGGLDKKKEDPAVRAEQQREAKAEAEEMRAGLADFSLKQRLPICEMMDFFGPTDPAGCAFVDYPDTVKIGNTLHRGGRLIVFRTKPKGWVEFAECSPYMEPLFDGEKDHREDISNLVQKLQKHAWWLRREKEKMKTKKMRAEGAKGEKQVAQTSPAAIPLAPAPVKEAEAPPMETGAAELAPDEKTAAATTDIASGRPRRTVPNDASNQARATMAEEIPRRFTSRTSRTRPIKTTVIIPREFGYFVPKTADKAMIGLPNGQNDSSPEMIKLTNSGVSNFIIQ